MSTASMIGWLKRSHWLVVRRQDPWLRAQWALLLAQVDVIPNRMLGLQTRHRPLRLVFPCEDVVRPPGAVHVWCTRHVNDSPLATNQ